MKIIINSKNVGYVLTIIFIILKLIGCIDWSWWCIFIPLYVSYSLRLIYYFSMFIRNTNRKPVIAYPSAKRHLYISLVKSTIRIVAGIVLLFGMIPIAGILFIVAELLGILEELL